MTALTKQMSGISSADSDSHKEKSQNRITSDEEAVQSIVDVVTQRMVNPFVTEEGANTENRQPLLNIATSAVAPEKVTDDLCNIRQKGRQVMGQFLQTRLQDVSIDIVESMTKPGLQTFASLNKPIQV